MIKLYAARLQPGSDLKRAIAEFVSNHSVTAGVVVSGVGSLSHVNLRMAGAKTSLERAGLHEIVSLNGTVGTGGMHLHMSVSDVHGNVIGGHLKDGCLVKTTVELVIAADPDQTFARRPDLETGFDELVIE